MTGFPRSCNPACQRDHWKSAHKAECASFKQPPLAKTFDPSNRADVPWPQDPILAQGTEDGLGVWLSPSPFSVNVALVDSHLLCFISSPTFYEWAVNSI